MLLLPPAQLLLLLLLRASMPLLPRAQALLLLLLPAFMPLLPPAQALLLVLLPASMPQLPPAKVLLLLLLPACMPLLQPDGARLAPSTSALPACTLLLPSACNESIALYTCDVVRGASQLMHMPQKSLSTISIDVLSRHARVASPHV
jgi:hypothetical protein